MSDWKRRKIGYRVGISIALTVRSVDLFTHLIDRDLLPVSISLPAFHACRLNHSKAPSQIQT